MLDDFARAIADCLAPADRSRAESLVALVRDLLDDRARQGDTPPSRAELEALQKRITAELDGIPDAVGLVYGGATKIKDYVFEAPLLPEIRGASVLLDWVNEAELPRLWGAPPGNCAANLALQRQHGIVFASGGNILAFTPAANAAVRAAAIEHSYADWALTADSVAVFRTCTLLELRYGLRPLDYWVDDLKRDWAIPARRALLSPALGMGEAADPAADAADPAAEAADLAAAEQLFYQGKTFGELVRSLAAQFYRRRDERAEPPFGLYAQQPWSARCASSGNRPAVVERRQRDDLEPSQLRALSEASARKRFAGIIYKEDKKQETGKHGKWFTDTFGWNKPARLTSWQEWIDDKDRASWEDVWRKYLDANKLTFCAQHAHAGEALPARDVHEIGAASGRSIGLIYADGNRVGALLRGLRTPDAYAAASQALRDATRSAVLKALANHITPVLVSRDPDEEGSSAQPPRDKAAVWVFPFELLSIGGDDVQLIVPGDKALDIALDIAYYFEHDEGLAQIAGKVAAPAPDRYRGHAIATHLDFSRPPVNLGLSAGVVVAQETSPIFFLRNLVDELLGQAKKYVRTRDKQLACVLGHGQGGGGAIDFMIMRSVTMVSDRVDSFRAAALGDAARPNETTHRQTARPYSWHELAGLLGTARALREVRMARSQLYRLREVLAEQDGVIASSLEYLYTRARMDRPRGDAVLKHVELAWGAAIEPNRAGSSAPPWLRRHSANGKEWGWETIWPDLVEIFDVIA